MGKNLFLCRWFTIIRINEFAPEVFSSNSLSTTQFGGNQMKFKKNNLNLVQNEKVQNIIKSYWLDATEEDMGLLLYKCNTGCGYIALINSVFKPYEGKEREFEKIFEFPMYTVNGSGDIDYNYEFLALEYFCYLWGNSVYNLEEIYGNINYMV